MNYIIFYIVILVANIIQGITGFAGTILAMPPSLMVVGYPVAKPILNVLGILAGLYVFILNYKDVNWKELKKISLIMSIGIFGGFYLKKLFVGRDKSLFFLLGVFVIVIAIQGFIKIYSKSDQQKQMNPIKSLILILSAGIIHGMFLSGGPLLIGYLSKQIEEKQAFRATISTTWILLNSMILMNDLYEGVWNPQLLKVQLISIPFLIIGIIIGTKLYVVMSQKLFMKITYSLLMISGFMLVIK